jgi:putative oxidoreductase
MQKILSSNPWHFQLGLNLIRIITGLLMVYHGAEVLDPKKISDYANWLTDLHFPAPSLMAYLGKGAEFIGGILFTVGLLTRLATVALAITMAVITFGMGSGKFLTEDQHPFMFLLMFILFFFTGAGKISFDYLLFSKKK